MSIFLATTALSEFWPSEPFDGEILFLGSWCLRYDRRTDWESRRYEVLPCPWDDRERFYKAAGYVDQCGERMLEYLTEHLNSIHGVSHLKRYWRILLGPWLLHYLHCMYDRYVHLCEALKRYPGLQTIVLDPDSYRTPSNALEFIEFVIDDPYNLQIFSQQLHAMGHRFPVRTLEAWGSGQAGRGRPRWGGGRSIAKWVLHEGKLVMRRSMEKRCLVALYGLNWRRSQLWFLAWKTGFRAIPFEMGKEWSFTIGKPILDDRRNTLKDLPVFDEFGRLLALSLPQDFPPLYIEHYQKAKDEALTAVRNVPYVIASATDWYSNEPFKFIAAEASERGRRLVTVQHGGGYGTFRSCPPELHESRLGDSFKVWGWADEREHTSRNLPSPLLSSLLTKHRRNCGSKQSVIILFVATSHPRYLYRFHSTPVGSQWSEYFEWGLRYFAALSDRLRSLTDFRPYSVDYGNAVRQRFSERFPTLRWDASDSVHEKLAHVRLVVVDHLVTTFLETLVANVPTVLFCDPLRWEVREKAVPYFDELHAVGILWYSPEDAASKVAEVYDDTWAWWGSEAVQRARRTFVGRYALARRDWYDHWARVLHEGVMPSKTTRTSTALPPRKY